MEQGSHECSLVLHRNLHSNMQINIWISECVPLPCQSHFGSKASWPAILTWGFCVSLLNTGIRMANGCVHLPYETLAMTGL